MQRSDPAIVTLRALILERSAVVVIVAVLLGILLNGLTSWLNTIFSIPLFLDTIFTLAVGAVFGPVAGAITGLGTSLFHEVIYDFSGTYWPFGVVNAASGIIVGLLAAAGKFHTGLHLVFAVLLLTLANAFLGSLVAVLAFGGATGIEIDYIVMGLLLTGKPVLWAAFLARIPANVVDKALSVLVAYWVYRIAFLHSRD
jgi:energy-coupling factor transport system substrate-specific component